MSVVGLDHFTIITADLRATREFYADVLGLMEGPRPPFDFPGAWFYCGDRPIVHVIAGREPKGLTTGPVDHIALRAGRFDDFLARIEARGVAYRQKIVPLLGTRQVFMTDPNGIRLELNFDPAG